MQIYVVYLNIILHVNPHEQEIRLQGIFPVETVLSKLYANRILPKIKIRKTVCEQKTVQYN